MRGMRGVVAGLAVGALLPLSGCARSASQGAAAPSAQTAAGQAAQTAAAPARVILVIGDGMGVAQWTLLRLARDTMPAVAALPYVGLVDTRCDCGRTTDSAAGATAYAIGQRTAYRFVGITADSSAPTTVLQAAQARGLGTGIVTSTHVTDASPAAFYARSPSRYDRATIARHLSEANIDVVLGGGRAYFESPNYGGGLLSRMAGYTQAHTPDAFEALDLARTDRLIGLFADSTMWELPRSVRPTLPQMARAALTILDRNPRGFFLLLESEDTDDAFHSNLPADSALSALLELDAMIAEALAYQARNPETLIVVVGDHETGGLGLQLRTVDRLSAEYTTTGHTADMVPLFAGGPGAASFAGWRTNDEVGRLLMRAVRGELADTR